MRKSLKKSLTMFIAFTIVICSPAATKATLIQDIITTQDSRLYNVYIDQMQEMLNYSSELNGSALENDINMKITTIKEINDFAGNSYTLIECDPIGYMIYHNESGIFVEYSPRVCSPYHDQKGTFLYNGPNGYYVFDDNNYEHIIDHEILSNDAIMYLEKSSEEINKQLVANKNKNILDYVAGKSDTRLSTLYALEKSQASTNSTITTNGWTCITRYEILSKMSDCGYIAGGKCGYIAAGILLTYKTIIGEIDGVTKGSHYTYSSTKKEYCINPILPTALYNRGTRLGYEAKTTSVAIHYTVESWLADRRISVNHVSLSIPIASNQVISSHITNNRPVIWFGDVLTNDYSDDFILPHAVVVYGYKTTLGTYSYVAHFGWTNASEVYFTGVLGSIYTFS